MAKPRCRTAIPIATLARQKMLSTKKTQYARQGCTR